MGATSCRTLCLTLLKIKIIQPIPQQEYCVGQGTVMTGFFLREDELSKTMESTGMVPHFLDHSPALSEQDEQGSPRGRDQVEL